MTSTRKMLQKATAIASALSLHLANTNHKSKVKENGRYSFLIKEMETRNKEE